MTARVASSAKERPILFSSPMIRAILAGQKSMTRRVFKPGRRCLDLNHEDDQAQALEMCPYGKPGDKLWVRETWASAYGNGSWGTLFAADWAYVQGKRKHEKGPHFCASYDDRVQRDLVKWRPSIFMPRWASRITLEITDMRAEQLQDISEEDALAEGIEGPFDVGYRAFRIPDDSKPRYSSAVAAFESLWDSINGERPGCAWRDNPWVWVISFKRVQP